MASGKVEVEIAADAKQLSAGLAAAERELTMFQSRMMSTAKASRETQRKSFRYLAEQGGRAGDEAGKAFGGKWGAALAKAGIAAAVVKTIAGGLDAAVSMYKEKGKVTGKEFALGFGQSFADTLGAIPVVGQIGEIIGIGVDKFLGDDVIAREAESANRMNNDYHRLVHSAAKRRDMEQQIADELKRQEQLVASARMQAEQMEKARTLRAADRMLGQDQQRFSRQDFTRAEDINAAAGEIYSQINALAQREAEFAKEKFDAEMARIEEIHKNNAGEMEAAKILAKARFDEEMAAINQTRAAREQAMSDLHGQRLDQLEAEQAAEAEAARRAQEEAEKAAQKAAEKEAKRLQQIAEARMQMEREIAEARSAAAGAVAGMTATAGTAGGSFTYGVEAQINETKLLRSISQQSRDFLSQIVTNTARLGGLGFA